MKGRGGAHTDAAVRHCCQTAAAAAVLLTLMWLEKCTERGCPALFSFGMVEKVLLTTARDRQTNQAGLRAIFSIHWGDPCCLAGAEPERVCITACGVNMYRIVS
jgi:hypothetical protein